MLMTVFIPTKIQNESNSQQWHLLQLNHLHCIYPYKDTKWKQFTTKKFLRLKKGVLYLSLQRYKMKAIHNKPIWPLSVVMTVFIPTKIQNESNSQPVISINVSLTHCIYPYKDTKWKQFTTVKCLICDFPILYLSLQRYKMKAIHNIGVEHTCWGATVFIPTKIQNESNSQRQDDVFICKANCIYPYKDTKWKQFTT